MLFKATVAVPIVLTTLLAATPPARAQGDEVSRPVIFALDLGVSIPSSGRFFGGDVNSPLALGYLGIDLHIDLSTYVGMGLFAAVIPALGGVVGGSARLTQPWRRHCSRWTAGLGPAYASSGSILAEGDVSLEVRSRAGVAMVLGPAFAVALNSAGDARCGVDTCDAYIPPGAYVLLFRIGLGVNL